jgi:hypothetical protein
MIPMCKSNNDNPDMFLTYGFIMIGIYFLCTSFVKMIRNNIPDDLLNNDIKIIPLNNHYKMKMYENYTDEHISHVGSERPFIIRLNGRNFKKIMHNDQYKISLESVGKELMREFHAQTAIVYNDEILLIFSPSENQQFKGKCRKLQSIIASFASSLLTLKLNEVCSFHLNIIDFYDNQSDMIHYIKWRYNNAMSLKKNPVFIKRQHTSIETKYKHIKFNLSNIRDTDDYIMLLTCVNFNIDNYNIKIHKTYEMDETIE